MTEIDDLRELQWRLVAAAANLREIAADERADKMRLDGKVEGVKLAASYVEEILRRRAEVTA